MADSPDTYIRTVHHLIEKCLMYRMNKAECMEALHKHANINPVITSTVWAELEKENREFFGVYTMQREELTAAEIQRMLAHESTAGDLDDDE